MFTVTADPTVAFVDALKARLSADATLVALVTGIFGHLSEAARVSYPYVVLGRRTSDSEGGAMGLPGGQVSLQIDVWSNAKGPFEASAICSRIYQLLERYGLVVPGFDLLNGSLHRAMQEVFDEPDADSPNQLLYHGVQRWMADIHERI